MGLIKPLTKKTLMGELDANGASLQLLETVHRVAALPVERGREQATPSDFSNPVGVASYNGFGADGWYYEGGVQQRTWTEFDSIDDFTDKVTDPNRWSGIGTDLTEGGIDISDTPFGKRLHAVYTGPGAEVYDREGLMVFTHGGSGSGILSGRIKVPSEILGANIENSMLLGIQQDGVNTEYLFVGVVSTTTFPRHVVMGYVAGGAPTVASSVLIPAGIEEVNVAIEVDFVAGTYRGHFSFDPIDTDYNVPPWTPLSALVAWPGTWPAASVVPRIHTEFPAGYTVNDFHALSDVRVEPGGGSWVGNEKATWWLEALDGTNSIDHSNAVSDAPDELVAVWERDFAGNNHLTLLDYGNPTTPVIWRRWANIGVWANTDNIGYPYWSPGWMDADEGHIILSRNTSGQITGSTALEATGEIWLFSLRWDRLMIFHTDGLGKFVTTYDPATLRVARESGTWGSRRWITQDTYQPIGNYDHHRQGDLGFAGTLKHRTSETVAPAITYDVSIRRCNDGDVYIAYGVQEVPATLHGVGSSFAGVIHLNEVADGAFGRRLNQISSVTYSPWNRSDEAWVLVGLSYDQKVWWLQGHESIVTEELQGILSVRDFSGDSPGTLSASPNTPDTSWGSADMFGAKGLQMSVQHLSTSDEVVLVCSGWIGGSWITALYYDSASPSGSITRTFGCVPTTEAVTAEMNRVLPYNEFPRWHQYYFANSNIDLARCRTTYSAGQGSDSFVSILDGGNLSYVKWDGLVVENYKHEIIRGMPVHKDDFVIELVGYFIPPFGAGYGHLCLDHMDTAQTSLFGLALIGERRTYGSLFLETTGNRSGLGGISAVASLEYVDSTGLQMSSAPYVTNTMFSLVPGALVRLRIKRSGTEWIFLYYDNELSTWVEVLQVTGPREPVLPVIHASMTDTPSIACASGVEWEVLRLAPADDPLGQEHFRPVEYPILQSNLASVTGVSHVREKDLSATLNSFAVGDGWAFPGLPQSLNLGPKFPWPF